MLTPMMFSCAEVMRPFPADNTVAVGRLFGEPQASSTQPTTAPAALPTTQPAVRAQDEVDRATAQAADARRPIIPAIGDIPLTPQTAILAALQNQPALRLEKLNPLIRKTYEQQQRAFFDPVLDASVQASHSRTHGPFLPDLPLRQGSATGQVGLSQFFPTGTTVGVSTSMDYTDSPLTSDDTYGGHVDLSVTQSLLRGAGVAVNLVSLRQARVDILSSEYELRGYVESLVQSVEDTYWDYALAQRQIEIFNESLQVARQQLDEAQELVNVGKLAEVELAGAQAEVALRKEDLINARANLQKLKLQLLQLIGPDQQDLWDRPVVLLTNPFEPRGLMDPVADHVALALKMRPDLNQARLQVQRGDLELVRTRNGLLPELDLFIALGKSGYANSFTHAINNITSSSSYDASAGLTLQYPLENRDATAAHQRAIYSRDQQIASLKNLQRLAIVDVRGAYIEVNRAREQIDATAATRKLQESKLQNETEKFRLGKSTSLLVAQAQRDLLGAQIDEVNAVVSYLKATVALFAQDGSLLARRHIVAPGAKGVEGINDWR
jgi:outer membrane protein TolC